MAIRRTAFLKSNAKGKRYLLVSIDKFHGAVQTSKLVVPQVAVITQYVKNHGHLGEHKNLQTNNLLQRAYHTLANCVTPEIHDRKSSHLRALFLELCQYPVQKHYLARLINDI